MTGKAKAAAFSLLMVVMAGRPLTAQDVSVSFVDGRVSQQTGSSWKELAIGDAIPADSTLRVDAHAYVELSAGNVRITLSQPGTYLVKRLLSASLSLRSTGAGKALTAMLSKLVSGSQSKQAGAGGARAENMEKSRDLDLMTSEAAVFLEAGRDFIGSGQFDKAIEQMEKAVAAAEDDERAEARYSLAEAYSLNGDTRKALAQIRDLQADTAAPWWPDFVLLKGKILVDASAFDQAVKWLVGNGRGVADDDRRTQTYFFLLGVAYRGTGNADREKQCLARVVAASEDSELGEAAAKLLQGP